MSEDHSAAVQLDMVIVGAGFAGLYMIHKAQEEGLSVQCFEAGEVGHHFVVAVDRDGRIRGSDVAHGEDVAVIAA